MKTLNTVDERQPRPGEIQLKAWVAQEAERIGKTTGAVWQRLARGRHYKLNIRKVTRWLQYVTP